MVYRTFLNHLLINPLKIKPIIFRSFSFMKKFVAKAMKYITLKTLIIPFKFIKSLVYRLCFFKLTLIKYSIIELLWYWNSLLAIVFLYCIFQMNKIFEYNEPLIKALNTYIVWKHMTILFPTIINWVRSLINCR